MKNIKFLLIVTIFLIFILGCTNKQITIDCVTDTECFVKNFKSCTPAKIYEGTTEILGGSPQSCEVILFSQEDPQYTGGKRLSMKCIVENTDTFNENEINMNGIYERGSSCEGKLYDFLVEIRNQAEELINTE